MFRTPTPAADGRPGWIALGLVVGALATSTAYAQTQTQTPPTQQPPPAQPAQQAQPAPAARVFASDAGMVLNFIKPDKTADFEAVMTKLKEALQKSEKPERKQQAASWKIFKSPEPAQNGNVLYVFIIDPAVKSADYTVSTILAEAFPQEVQTLYKQYADAYASGQNFVNLSLVSDMGKAASASGK
jgi:pyruvate/2-oxoglutarate dehydrogenase complex dihydrolipoamide acyltransferase (E2) component